MPSPKTSPTLKTQVAETSRTKSFDPIYWAGTVLDNDDGEENDPSSMIIHTLILGTHPSQTSLQLGQNFGHPQNAFWWIAGDCLGFRRAAGVKADGKSPMALAQYLRYDGSDKILGYDDQVRVFCSHGFALWDVVKSCVRPGSLDSNIKKEETNDIRGFVEQHAPNVKRIVFANGGTSSALFCKHYRDWWMQEEDEGEDDDQRQHRQLVPGSNPESIKAFARLVKARNKKLEKKKGEATNEDSSTLSASSSIPLPPIECISALSVSPAAAKYTYVQKRDFWETYVYGPGLQDFEEWKNQQKNQHNKQQE